MLNKRYQVLLSDWMEKYINLIAEKYDQSFSSVIRVHLCLSILFIIQTLYPEYRPNLQDKELIRLAKTETLDEVEAHKMMSKILFEARKAVEYRFSKEKGVKKK